MAITGAHPRDVRVSGPTQFNKCGSVYVAPAAVVQTAGDLARWHPHVHALVSRGGWTPNREWVPLPYVDEHAAELVFTDPAVSDTAPPAPAPPCSGTR
jgi:hypothetical protein